MATGYVPINSYRRAGNRNFKNSGTLPTLDAVNLDIAYHYALDHTQESHRMDSKELRLNIIING